jgi:hypothetical protein
MKSTHREQHTRFPHRALFSVIIRVDVFILCSTHVVLEMREIEIRDLVFKSLTIIIAKMLTFRDINETISRYRRERACVCVCVCVCVHKSVYIRVDSRVYS